jgi:sugar/nucleoside kinase (ribokinase family)
MMAAMAIPSRRTGCLIVGDIALERDEQRRTGDHLAGVAARVSAHAAALGSQVTLVAKAGADDAGRSARDMLHRLQVDLRYLYTDPTLPTTTWQTGSIRSKDAGLPATLPWIRRGADMALRLDELPSTAALEASLVVASGYSLSVEPARSAVLGALRSAPARGARAMLVLEAGLLWQTNARMARTVLEPALAAADVAFLTTADAGVLAGPRWRAADLLRQLQSLGPTVVLLLAGDQSIVVEGRRHHDLRAETPTDLYAVPGAFAARLSAGSGAHRAAVEALRYASSVRRAGAPHAGRSPVVVR